MRGGQKWAGAAAVAVLAVAAGCSGSGSSRGASTATPTSGYPAPDFNAPRTMASRSVIEPDSIAGIPLGATRDQASAVLGNPTTTSSHRDSAGPYETLHWQLSGVKGLALSWRSGSRYSPGLTDWQADIRGPATGAGVEVGTQADPVIAAYGALADFCCATKAAVVERGGGRLVVMVQNNTRLVTLIVAGDPVAYMRTIAE